MNEVDAVKKIENHWIYTKNRRIFRLLKTAICAAEYSLTENIIHQIAPKEAEFFKNEKFINFSIKFRFSGTEFPPIICFKIFAQSDHLQTTFINGKQNFDAQHSEASYSAMKWIGPRRYLQLLTQEMVHSNAHKIKEFYEIFTMKDYMKYLSSLDETPANLGGRCNEWRRLNSKNIKRNTILHNIIEFTSNKFPTDRAKDIVRHLIRHNSLDNIESYLAQLDLLTMPFETEDNSDRIILQQQSSFYRQIHRESILSSKKTTASRGSKQSRSRSERIRQLYMPPAPPPQSIAVAALTGGTIDSQHTAGESSVLLQQMSTLAPQPSYVVGADSDRENATMNETTKTVTHENWQPQKSRQKCTESADAPVSGEPELRRPSQRDDQQIRITIQKDDDEQHDTKIKRNDNSGEKMIDPDISQQHAQQQNWEDSADQLFEWSRELTVTEILNSPRLA